VVYELANSDSCWSDVHIEQHKVNGEQQKLARIHVRAETSKVRTSRTFLCRNGQYFERLREISKPKIADELIFRVDNENELSKRMLRFKRVKPSVGTLAICAGKLQHYGRCMTVTERHTQLGKRFIELSEQCHKQINSDAVGWWKDEVRV